jgi:hypothetical protein
VTEKSAPPVISDEQLKALVQTARDYSLVLLT